MRADPAAAAALVVQANPSLEAKAAARIDPPDAARRAAGGRQALRLAEPRGVGDVRNWMYSHKLLEHDPNAGLPPFTNEFLPGQGI